MAPEVKARVDAAKVGRKQPADAVAKRAEMARQRMRDPEFKAKAVACLKNSAAKRLENWRLERNTEEARVRDSEQAKSFWKDPEIKKKRYEASCAARRTEEERKRVSAQAKARWVDDEYRKRVGSAISEGLKRSYKNGVRR